MARDQIFGVRPEQGRRVDQENDYNTSCSPEFKFAGYQYDSESGNYYAMARYYNPRLGRFMSPDPLGGAIGNPQSLNRYSYVLNNPESFVDPLGLKCVTLDDGTRGDDGTLPKCNDPSVWTSETVTVNGGGGETPSELYQLLWEAEYGLQPTTPPLVYARLPFGGGPRPVGPNKPQTQGQNGCLVTVFDPSCKPKELPPCPEVGAKAALNAFANGGPVFPPGENPEDLVRAGGAYAASYIMEHGLVVPLRSSVVRGILGVTEDVSLAVAAYPVVEAEVEGLKKEARDWSRGACSTAWTN